MLEFKRTPLPSSTLAHSPEYIPLIKPEILPQLPLLSSEFYWVAVEAHLHNQLVGLALAEVYPHNHFSQLYSFVVQENYRRQGIGTQLFAFLQKWLIEQEQVQALGIEYERKAPYAPALEKIVASQGWLPPYTYLIRCHFDVRIFNPPWFHRSYAFPPSFQLFPWKELLPAERKHIDYMEQQGMFPPYLFPFQNESQLDLETSVGLRQNGQLVGWSITHRLDPETISYSILYIDRSLHRSGLGIQLLIASIQRQKQSLVPYALFEVKLKEIDPSWWHFVKKRLIPTAQRVERMRWAIHVFV